MFLRKSMRPRVEMSTPSMVIEPEVSSTIRKSVAGRCVSHKISREDAGARTKQTSLARTRPTDEAYLLTGAYREIDTLQHGGKLGTILEYDVLDLDGAGGWPRRGWCILRDIMRGFLLDVVRVMNDALDRVHVVLDLSEQGDNVGE